MKIAAVVALAVVAGLPPMAAAGQMPQPPGLVVHRFQNPACEDLACASPPTNEIWVAPGEGRYSLAHETGHVWFYTIPTDEQRAWFIQQLRLPMTEGGGQLIDGAWYRGTGLHGHYSPDERAADAYAMCDLGRSPLGKRHRDGSIRLKWESAYEYQPTWRQHARICTAIWILGQPHTK